MTIVSTEDLFKRTVTSFVTNPTLWYIQTKYYLIIIGPPYHEVINSILHCFATVLHQSESNMTRDLSGRKKLCGVLVWAADLICSATRTNYYIVNWVNIRANEVETFTEPIHAVDNNIKFPLEDVRGHSLPFLDCAVHTEEDRSLNIEVYRKPTHRSILAVWLSSPTGAHAGSSEP